MEAAKVLAGFSLGEADLLRRAMGKKIKSEMDAQRAGFVDGCERVNAIPAAKANELFDLIDKFAGYGFNKSHAAAYALVAYQTAWLKAHHPVEFYAASMCFDMHADRQARHLRRRHAAASASPACRPSINASEAEFSVEAHGEGHAVRYALGALKGVGEKAMEQLVDERARERPVRQPRRFRRADRSAPAQPPPDRKPRRRRRLRRHRRALGGRSPRPRPSSPPPSSAADARTSGQGGLFGEGPANVVPIRMPTGENWTLAQRMAAEKESFGFYFSAHPVDNYRHLAEAHGARRFAELAALPAPADGGRTGAVMAGLVEDTRWRTSARGRRYMMATLSDSSGQFEATVFDDQVAEQVAGAAKAGGCALLSVELDRRPGEETPRVTIRSLQSLRKPRQAHPAPARGRGRGRGGGAPPRRRSSRASAAATACSASRRASAAGEADLVLGRDFLVDAELAARLERIEGVTRALACLARSAR